MSVPFVTAAQKRKSFPVAAFATSALAEAGLTSAPNIPYSPSRSPEWQTTDKNRRPAAQMPSHNPAHLSIVEMKFVPPRNSCLDAIRVVGKLI
jgi:hypothetical protein